MYKPGFGVLAVKWAGANSAIGRGTDHPWHGPAPAVVRGGGELDDRVKGRGDKVGELHLDHGPQPHERHTGGGADKTQFGQGRVEHAARTKLGLKVLGDLEGAAKTAGNIFAHHQHVGVAPHFLAQPFADGGDVGERAVDGPGAALLAAALICAGKAEVAAGCACCGHGAYTPSVTVAGSGSGLASANSTAAAISSSQRAWIADNSASVATPSRSSLSA